MIIDKSKNSWHFINKGISWINYDELKKALSSFDKAVRLEPDKLLYQNLIMLFSNHHHKIPYPF